MSSYEFSGKSVKEAVEKACAELKVEESALEVEVLEECSKGFLGIVGQRDARIRVSPRENLREIATEEPAPPAMDEEAPAPRSADAEAWGLSESPGGETSERSTEGSPALDQAREILEGILGRMTVEAAVESHLSNGSIYLDIKGDGSGLLIGKKGQTLNALQFLVSKIMNKENSGEDKVRVIVDTENYRLRKEENLREKAIRMGQRAKKTLKPVWLGPLPPNERRIVHMILADDREVYTKSHGEGNMRKIVVYPRRAANKRRGR
jgi:spoIIIJ-associated protein